MSVPKYGKLLTVDEVVENFKKDPKRLKAWKRAEKELKKEERRKQKRFRAF